MTADSISPRDLRKAERRNAILLVARCVFLAQGYAGATMSEVASKLGGSKSTLWTYFPDKSDLFLAVVLQEADDFRLALQKSIAQQTGIDGINAFVETYIRLLCRPDTIAIYRMIISEVGRWPELGATFFRSALGPAKELMTAYLARLACEGILQIDDYAAATDLLRSLCHGKCFQEKLFNQSDVIGEDEIMRDARIAADTFIRLYRRQRCTSAAE